MTTRIAVAGCGRLAREVFLPILTRTPDAAVVALADPDDAALAEAARTAPGAVRSADWRDAVAHDADAVLIALPTALHAEAAIAALEAGRHLYLEKPLAATLDEGRAVLARWTPGRAAMVGFNYRFNPLLAELRDRVAAGAIGAVRAVRTTFTTASTPGSSWRHPGSPGGGVLLDLGSHHVDLVRFLTGHSPVAVHCALTARPDGCERAMLQLQLAGGVLAQIAVATGAADDDRVEVSGDAGTLSVDRYRSLVVQHRGPGGPSAASSIASPLTSLAGWRYALRKRRSPWHEPSHAAALAHFLHAVRHGTAPSPGLEDGWQSLRTVSAAATSAATGKVVDFGEDELHVGSHDG